MSHPDPGRRTNFRQDRSQQFPKTTLNPDIVRISASALDPGHYTPAVDLGNKTYRYVGDELVKGVWRPVLTENYDDHSLDYLYIYADGVIRFETDFYDLDELRDLLIEGDRIVTGIADGTRVSAHEVGSWTVTGFRSWVTAEELIGEIADEIETLNGRPDSTDRCRQALDRFLASRSEEDRSALRAAYDAIPGHRKIYVLGDMAAKESPLVNLLTPVGEDNGWGVIMTEEMLAEELEYFAQQERWGPEPVESRADGPADPTVTLLLEGHTPEEPLTFECLRNDYPVRVEVDGQTYPSATHAFWALSTTDATVRAAIRDCEWAFDAEEMAGQGTPTPGWPQLRITAMHRVIRAKFDQNPEFADVLIESGDARIDYSEGALWLEHSGWIGRLLELARSEIAAQRAGL